MRGSSIPVLMVLGCLAATQAGEIQQTRVEHRDGEYQIEMAVKVNGERDAIYAIATDYRQLARLSKLIVESGLVERVSPEGEPVVRRRMVMRACMMKFCFDATLVEDVWEPASGLIRTVFIPEESDFIEGEAVWLVSRIDDTNTMINFNSRFRPAFWVPPLIGPYFIKRLMLGAAEETILNIEQLAAIEKPRS